MLFLYPDEHFFFVPPGKITSRTSPIYPTMANIGYFQVPADDVGRAKKFYQALLGWKIEPDTTLENKTLEWQNIITGEPEPGTMNAGGLYKRMGPGPIMNFVIVQEFDTVLAQVAGLGGKVVMPKNKIRNVGTVAVIQDTEGNILGLWKPLVQ
jgi:predicted enzyme related to lactoylglutathione lyase